MPMRSIRSALRPSATTGGKRRASSGTTLNEQSEVWCAAFLMLDMHGDAAAAEAARRAMEQGAAGDQLGEMAWLRIVDAIADLLRVPNAPPN
jgi:hypothetical protein